jgi:hypothetical protein
MIILNMEQGTDEWHNAKLGVPSASKFSEIITRVKGELSKSRTAYAYRLALEMIAGKPIETFSSKSMQRGIEMEPEARDFFQLITGLTVHQVGFCFKDDRMDRGASPDGLIGESEGAEIKCPELSTHCKWMAEDKLPGEHFHQVQGNMYITGRDKWHFFSYFPGVKPFHIVVGRDEEWIGKLDKALDIFIADLNEVYKKLTG